MRPDSSGGAGASGTSDRGLAFAVLALGSAVLLCVRFIAAERVGFGDSEALYAAYALHPQAAYLDHPGLVGIFARALGSGTAPLPADAHRVTALMATLVPWAIALTCRAAGSTWARALATAVVVAFVPEIAIGLFAMTPDLLLALLWAGALALGAVGLTSRPASARATLAFASAGLVGGIAAATKVTGVLLLAGLVVAYASRPARAHAKTVAPWAGLAAGLVVLSPVALYEAHAGWPMLHHRLADTQASAGLSLRNAAALVGGQLAYLSPLTAWLAYRAGRAAWRGRCDPVGQLLLWTSALPAAILLPLCLWSRVAEPHWIAPALLALAPAIARAPAADLPSRRLVVAAAALGAALVGCVHAWILVPESVRLAPAGSYDAKLDIANELYGWPEVASVVRAEVATQASPGLEDVAVVGPHWVICAQLEAEFRGDVHVGCDTPVPDDFDGWWPRENWHAAGSLIWVSDERFGPPPSFPTHDLAGIRKVRVYRGGRVVRVFTITLFARRADG